MLLYAGIGTHLTLMAVIRQILLLPTCAVFEFWTVTILSSDLVIHLGLLEHHKLSVGDFKALIALKNQTGLLNLVLPLPSYQARCRVP